MRPLVSFCYRWISVVNSPRQSSEPKRAGGFTLLELLISLVIAALVVSTLLYIVVELTKADKRESNLDQVQRDINRGMEYIVNDLQEAVYVYQNPQTIANRLAGDTTSFPSGTGTVPILAFWRIDPIEDNLPTCNSTTMTTIVLQQCQLLTIRQAAYTLVVYVQRTNDGTNSNWSGQSRIIRYELTKYASSPPTATFTTRSGYRDPTDPTDPQAAFENWQPSGTPRGSSAVLIDFVQAPTLATPVALNRKPLSDSCLSYGTDGTNPLYTITPSTATTTVNNSFFACVRNPQIGVAVTRGNQDIYVFLRGNVQSIKGGVGGFSKDTSLPILETQVAVKGVVNKGFNQ